MNGKWDKSPEEIQSHLKSQVRFLRNSMDAYDKGEVDEAARLANHVFQIVQDRGRQQRSVLTHLQARDKIQFINAARIDPPGNQAAYIPLAPMSFSSGPDGNSVTFTAGVPKEPKDYRLVPVDEWWNGIVFRGMGRDGLSREALVESLRDQDGGSHVDGSLTDQAYISASRKNGPGFVRVRDIPPERGIMITWAENVEEHEDQIRPGPHFATMRAVAWELEESLILAGLIEAR